MPNVTLRVPVNVPISGKIPVEWQRYFADVASPLSPSGSGTIYTSSDGGATTTLMTLSSLLTTGMIAQVVVGTSTTSTTNATNVYADSTLTASISPTRSTSKILACVFQNGCRKDTGDTAIQLKLVRGVTTIGQLADGAARTGSAATNDVGTIAGVVFDAPATTNSTTYKTQLASKDNIANATVQSNSALSTIVLLEVIQ